MSSTQQLVTDKEGCIPLSDPEVGVSLLPWSQYTSMAMAAAIMTASFSAVVGRGANVLEGS